MQQVLPEGNTLHDLEQIFARKNAQRRAEQQHPQHRLDGAVLAHAQVRDQKQQTQQKKRRELRK